MSTNRRRLLTREELEKIGEWVDSLSDLSEREGYVIVVEGRRDRESLSSLGVRGRFELLWRLLKRIRRGDEGTFSRGYVILTDFDAEGRVIHDRLKEDLASRGAKVAEWPRIRYRKLGLPPKVEEAYPFVRNRVKWS